MKVKTILNLSTGLLTVGGASAGGYYALNPSKKSKTKVNMDSKEIPEFKGTKSIKEILTKAGLNILNTSTNENDKDWENLIKKMLDQSVNKEEKISAVIITSSNPAQDGPANMKNIKNACNELFQKIEGKDSEFEKNKTITENWCTKESKFLKGIQ